MMHKAVLERIELCALVSCGSVSVGRVVVRAGDSHKQTLCSSSTSNELVEGG